MENNIVDDRFGEWTFGLDPSAARIAVFNKVRDIPYMIIPELRSPDAGPSGILGKNCGSCQPKHWLLAIYFKKLGIPVRYATYPFYWHTGNIIKYPPELRAMMKDLPITNHLAIKADIEGRWVLVDATYDLRLGEAGFPVNRNWDGVNPTLNAVHPLKEILHDTPEERVAYDVRTRESYTDKEKSALVEFVPKLNAWFESLRA
ncbi:MAG: hypothetical protein NTZ95_07595 [Candidatus Omnitrophica bacterium]|nr:hypothetical protein [Candidatus Omnitrophota bacterium]